MYLYPKDVEKMSDQELFGLIAKYATLYVDKNWERIQVMWGEWAPGAATMLRQYKCNGVDKRMNETREQVTQLFKDDEDNAGTAFRILQQRIRHPEKETWKKAIFTLYPDGKFDIDLSYERPPMHPEFDNS